MDEQLPVGSYRVSQTDQWVHKDDKGRTVLTTHYVITGGDYVGRPVIVTTPISAITGTVELV